MKNSWLKYNREDRKKIFDFCEDYRLFISKNKTERECVREAINMAKKEGFCSLTDAVSCGRRIKKGDKLYISYMDKALALIQVGNAPLEDGLNILGAHIDCPRLDLKQKPLYEDSNLAMLDTHYYGGIKPYQWVTIPLAIHGVVALKNGSRINISIGEELYQPVVGVTDLLIHLSQKQLEKKGKMVVEGEDLNICIGNTPAKNPHTDEPYREYIERLLKDECEFEQGDFTSAELEIVPAGPARDYGLDRSMIMGYGQDDRGCAYPVIKALLETGDLRKTAMCLLTDKEEVGSVGATGAQGRFFENTIAELYNGIGGYSELGLRRILEKSKMLSCDVSAAYDPNYPTVMDKNNSAFLGYGTCINKYTGAKGKSGANDASAEYMAYIRKIFDENHVSWQTCELGKVDQGGGGTIAYIMANYGMEVIDSGIAILNMHSPWEICSKVDLFESYLGYKAFLKY